MVQIRTRFRADELARIDGRRGALTVAEYVRRVVEKRVYDPPAETVQVPEGRERWVRVAVNLPEDLKQAVEREAGSIAVSRWVRDLVLRVLGEPEF